MNQEQHFESMKAKIDELAQFNEQASEETRGLVVEMLRVKIREMMRYELINEWQHTKLKLRIRKSFIQF